MNLGSTACTIQAFVIEFGDIAPIIWNCIMAYNLYSWVCLGKEHEVLKTHFPWYLGVTLGLSLSLCTSALLANVYGEATLWCWIISSEWKYIALYGWVIACAVLMSYLLYRVQNSVNTRLKIMQQYNNQDATETEISSKIFLYVASFLVLWTPGLLDRTAAIVHREVFTLVLLHAWFVPLQGFVNAIIYGGFFSWLVTKVKLKDHAKHISNEKRRGKPIDLNLGIARVFTCTLNFKDHRNDYVIIPQDEDFDIYVVALQGCFDIEHMADDIKTQLEERKYDDPLLSTRYSVFSCHAKKTLLSILVFAPMDQVAAGNVARLDCSSVDRSSSDCNCVGMAIQYFDSSLCFISTRIANDIGVMRDSVIRMITRLQMSLDDDSRIDFPYLYHHTFILGSIMSAFVGHPELLRQKIGDATDAVVARSNADLEHDSLFETKRCSFDSLSDDDDTVYILDLNELECQNSCNDDRRKKWIQATKAYEVERLILSDLTCRDQLRQMMECHELFGTFREAAEIEFDAEDRAIAEEEAVKDRTGSNR